MDVYNFIGSLGFPIVMCLIMFNYMNKERESHEHETEKLREILAENTKVLNDLKDILMEIKRSA